MKKSQISYTMLLGVIILTFSFILFFSINKQKPSDSESISFESVKVYVDQCLKSSLEQAILTTGIQGGLYNDSYNSLYYLFYALPYYSSGTTKSVIPLDIIEKQISYNTQDNLIYCLNDFEPLKPIGFTFEDSEPTAKALITDSQVIVDLSYPFKVVIGSTVRGFNKFSASVPSRYKLVHSVASNIAEDFSKDPARICISCMIDYAHPKDLNISVTNFGEKDVVVSILDKKVKINDNYFVFNFLHNTGGVK